MSRHGIYDLELGFIPDDDCTDAKPTKTNADKYFRNATDEELAEWLRGFAEKIAKQACEVYTMDADFEKDALDWLKQEVSDD